MKFVIIGAGVSGICAIHNIKENFPKAEIICIDINEDIGGTWLYQEKCGFDEFGLPVTSSMYKNLKTNLPKYLMQYSDFPFPEDEPLFMDSENFLKYLNNYANKFDIKKHIKFRHLVMSVKRVRDVWEVTYKDLKNDEIIIENFDYVLVCNGHYTHYQIPEFKGRDLFKGKQEHSHNYRVSDPYKNKRVLCVGAGSSGIDISMDIAKVAENVLFSIHKPESINCELPKNYNIKPDIEKFDENSVVFVDGSSEAIDVVIFCTGYLYHCPFLDPSCGVEVKNDGIRPLYRHIVNLNQKSMFFVGIPYYVCIIPLVDMQMRYIVALLKGKFQLPNEEVMLKSIRDYCDIKEARKFRVIHNMAFGELTYYRSLAKESGIISAPPVCAAIKNHLIQDFFRHFFTFRDFDYKVIDEEHFMKKPSNNSEWGDVIYGLEGVE